ncbi:DNA repair protein RecN [Paenibacillus sp. N1-5-1-14]|uniref:DNA repair protein RecN n=1 Tax=Paenibacillus radicibacter TaxID=2972488 RepID=UPI002158FE89|nr:DNA repair protein RecN [Paenibacillus radicibacter]MCR8642402.1 DNA repair protein RecN [Paenibacillus radicibacter]
MLTELSIRNLAVIEHVHVICKSGFHVLTGETGAGKSIIIDALSLIVGGRGSAEWIRYGSSKAEIEGLFEVESDHPVWEVLERLGIEASMDEGLLIRREITSTGKSTARINGQLVNLTMLREVGECLVNIHGQHEHQSLLKVEEHIHSLDAYGGEQLAPVKAAYRAAYDVYMALKKEMKALQDDSMQTLQRIDLYRFQIDEIAAAKLKVGEDVSLLEERRKLAYAEKLMTNVSESYDLIYSSGSGLDAVNKAMNRIQDIVSYDAKLQPLLEQLQSAYYQLEDAAYQLRDYRENIEFNPSRLDEIELRLDLISSLRKKYGSDVSEILAHYQTIKQELDALEHKDARNEELQQQLDAQGIILAEAGMELSARRKEASESLARDIECELRDLHMERTQFAVQIDLADDSDGIECAGSFVKFNREGIDQVEFMMAPNPGEPLRGLAKIASGGELSRIMLAMKTIFARIDRIPVLVFDEVDTGVSGRAAQAIAEKMSQLSGSCQVFSITHLPQVASMADVHLFIRKVIDNERTYTQVADLDQQGRIEELARMLGGAAVTETTLHHSQEMLVLANEKKTRI